MENFEIINKLGDGSYSTVYKVKRKIDNQIYALKKVKLINLSEKEKLNSLNEVRILASIKSNFVISYKEAFFDEKDNTLGIIMEFADNGDLYQKIVECKKKKIYIDEDEVWRIFIQLVKGLKSLHDLKILHRDIKSANVFLFKDGSAKLGDLNVSKVAKKGLGYTQTGTPYYASPEVWKDLSYDNKSDIWSLGCVLYEMITLFPPFRAQNMENLFKKVIKGEISKIPDKYSFDLFTVIQLLIQVKPEKRPSCDEILQNKIVLKKIEYFKEISKQNFDENDEEQFLLKTINVPKSLNFLTYQLPKPNYNKKKLITLNNKNKKIMLKNYNSYTNFNDLEKNKNKNIFPTIKISYGNNDKIHPTESKKTIFSYPKQIHNTINNINAINNTNTINNNNNMNNNLKIYNLYKENSLSNLLAKNNNNILKINNNSLNFINSIDTSTLNNSKHIEQSNSNDKLKRKIFKLNNSADKIKYGEEKKINDKEYIINNFNKEKLIIQLNNNINSIKHQNIIKNKKEMKIPIGRELPIPYKNYLNRNINQKNKYIYHLNNNNNNNNLMLNHNNQFNINNINSKKNPKLNKYGSEIYSNIKTQENTNMLPLIVSYKRDNSYQNIKPLNNINNNNKLLFNKQKLKIVPKYHLKPIKNMNILRINN